MNYIDGIRPARTGYWWTVQNKKFTPPIPNLLIMLPQLPSSDLLQVLRHFIQSLHSISTLFGLLQYLYLFYSTPFACNLFAPIPHLLFSFFPTNSPPPILFCFYHVLSLHLHPIPPFQSLHSHKIPWRSQAIGSFREINWETSVAQ